MPDQDAEPAERFVYLVQHGEAEPKSKDPQRPLTQRGRKIVEQMATWLAKAGLKLDQIRHSGKLRAQQTAEVLAESIKPREGVVSHPGLAPNDDVRPVAEALAASKSSVMLVGHLPFLARLVGAMLLDDPEQQPVRFCQGGLVGLVRQDDRWSIACVTPPEWVAGD